jgi:hypothetical protein
MPELRPLLAGCGTGRNFPPIQSGPCTDDKSTAPGHGFVQLPSLYFQHFTP